MRVVGCDGAPGGWAAVLFDTDTVGPDRWRVQFHETFAGMVNSYSHVACIAVDVPIGLLEGGTRQCDVEARRLLGPKRSSVFPAPDPRVFDADSQKTASARLVELTGKGMTHQAFGILGKVAEVNRAMSPLLQNWIR